MHKLQELNNTMIQRFMQNFNNYFDPYWIMITAKETGFLKRFRKISPRLFVLEIIFSAITNGRKTYTQICSDIMLFTGKKVSAQAICKRFNSNTVNFFNKLIVRALRLSNLSIKEIGEQKIPDFLRKFTSINAIDSTGKSLPKKLAEKILGCGGNSSESGFKAHLIIDLLNGGIKRWRVSNGRTNDTIVDEEIRMLGKNSLTLFDAGYTNKTSLLKKMDDMQRYFLGKYWSCVRMQIV